MRHKYIDKVILGFIHVYISTNRVSDLSWWNHVSVYVFGLQVFHARWHVGELDPPYALDNSYDESGFFVAQEFYPVSDGDSSKCIDLPVRRALMFLGLYP